MEVVDLFWKEWLSGWVGWYSIKSVFHCRMFSIVMIVLECGLLRVDLVSENVICGGSRGGMSP